MKSLGIDTFCCRTVVILYASMVFVTIRRIVKNPRNKFGLNIGFCGRYFHHEHFGSKGQPVVFGAENKNGKGMSTVRREKDKNLTSPKIQEVSNS